MMEWYAVHTRPWEEAIAESTLQRLGIESFLPQYRQQKLIRRKKQTVTGPLFPGYLFARFDRGTQFRAVNYAHGVRRVVTFGSVPVGVDDEMIESIRTRLTEGYVILPPHSFTPGQVVRIRGGVFHGLEAVFEREMNDRQRVVLLLQALSYHAQVVVDLEHVVNV